MLPFLKGNRSKGGQEKLKTKFIWNDTSEQKKCVPLVCTIVSLEYVLKSKQIYILFATSPSSDSPLFVLAPVPSIKPRYTPPPFTSPP